MQGRLPGTAPRALPVARPGAQRWRRRIAGWVVSGALALLAGPAAADALDDAGVTQERALLQFRLLVLEAGDAGAVARLARQDAMDLLARIADQRGLLEQVTYRPEDLDRLMGICRRAQDANNQLFQLGVPTAPAPGQLHEAFAVRVEEQMERNRLRFQPQLTVTLPFVMRCSAIMPRLLEQVLDTRAKQDIAESERIDPTPMRAGVQRGYLGVLRMVDVPGYGPDLKQALATALADTADATARMLSVPQRRAIAERLDASAAAAEVAQQAHLRKAAAIFHAAPCNALCQM